MIELTGKLPKYCRNTGNLIDPRFNINGFNPQRDYPKRTYAETYAITWTLSLIHISEPTRPY